MAFGDILKAFNQSGGQPGAIQPMQSPIGMPPIDDKADKNQKLGMMLYALGGALRGDKDFVQNTLAIQQMQESKKKEEEREKAWGDALVRMEGVVDPRMLEIAKLLGAEKGAAFVIPDKKDQTEFQINSSRLLELDAIDPSKLSPTLATEKNILEQKIYGKSEPIPFFNSEGLNVTTIDSVEYAKDPKKVLDEMESRGLYTIGAKPSMTPKGIKTPLGTIQENYLETKKQLDVVNDLANILVTNPDAFTVSGGLADLFNTAKYQAESALTMADFENFKATDPKEFQRIDNLLDTKYSKELDKISEDRAIAKSIFYKLAYVTAKDLDPSGRLSDNDLKAAMEVIGKLGANVNATVANLENVYNTRMREYKDGYNIKIDSVTDNQELIKAAKYKNLNPFLGGRDWRNAGVTAPSITTPPPATSTTSLTPLGQSLVDKYGNYGN
jgi:hypothetical protein